MRVESFGPRTWLLAAVCAGAAALCVLAFAGLGRRIRLPLDAGLAAPALPALPAAGGERLGAAERYAGIAAQPLFAPDRMPHPFYLSGGEGEGEDRAAPRLAGVLITPQLQMATLAIAPGQSLRLRLRGAPVNGWQLLELAPRSATITGPGGPRRLRLQVFAGPDQASASTADAAAPAADPAAADLGSSAPDPGAGAAGAGAAAAAAPAPSGPGLAAPPGPSAAQLQAIRERIRARRQQLSAPLSGSQRQ